MNFKYTQIILFLLFTVSTYANNRQLSLAQLRQKCEEARSLSQYQQLESYSDKYLQAAITQKDNHAETYAYFYNGLAKLFLGKAKESQILLNKAEEMSSANSNDSVKALVMNAKGIEQALIQNNNFIAQQYFFKSLELAKKSSYDDLQYRVRGNLLTLSHSMDDEIAFDNAMELYQYGKKESNNEHISMGAYYLATYHYKHQNYDETEHFLSIALDTYKKYPYEDISSVYALYAKMLLSKGNIQASEEKALQAIEFAKRYNQKSIEVDAYITYAEVLAKEKRYQQSNEMIATSMALADSIGMTNKSIDCNQILADNYIAMGNIGEAVKCLQVANSILSNQATLNMQRITHEQQVMHEIEEKEMEEKLRMEQMASQRKVLVALGAAVIFLLILLIVLVTTYRRRQVLYRKIVLQNSRAIVREKELQEQIRQLSDIVTNGAATGTEEKKDDKDPVAIGEDKIDELYNRLCRLMEEDKLYTEAQLTRDKMAEYLNTNRTYLTKAIKEKAGMNYLQFVNSYRINEAIRILSDKDKIDYPLKQIWSDLGFNSPTTFYKLFQQAVGITPSTYRKQFLEVNSETQSEDSEEWDNI